MAMHQLEGVQGLRALFINCTQKRLPEISGTQELVDASAALMGRQGVTVDQIRLVEHEVPPGRWPDMAAHGWPGDEWPAIAERVADADIVVLAGPLWQGEASSVVDRCLERLAASAPRLDGRVRVAGCLLPGSEAGHQQCAMRILYALNQLGFAIPPRADGGWSDGGASTPLGAPREVDRSTATVTANLVALAALLQAGDGAPDAPTAGGA